MTHRTWAPLQVWFRLLIWVHDYRTTPLYVMLTFTSGSGRAWVLRAQPFLNRIQQDSSSSSSSDHEAEARRHTANYVEARGMLVPATDYFRRAVSIAQSQGRLTGDLLAMVSALEGSLHRSITKSKFGTPDDYKGGKCIYKFRKRFAIHYECRRVSTSFAVSPSSDPDSGVFSHSRPAAVSSGPPLLL